MQCLQLASKIKRAGNVKDKSTLPA